jgi:hypothetical protein
MRAALFSISLLLASCGPEPARAPDSLPQASGPPLAQEEAPAEVQPAPPAGPRWESAVSAQGTALRLVATDGRELLRLACFGRPPELSVYVPEFRAIGSEDRLSLGFGDEPVALVADLSAAAPVGVEAKAPFTAELETHLQRNGPISATYGSQQSGPHAPPPARLASAFAEGCAKLRA